MKREPGSMLIEAAVKLLVHGCLLLFWAPILDWDVWFFVVLGVAALDVGGPSLPRVPNRVRRAAWILYFTLVGPPLILSYLLVAFYAPDWWLGITLLTALFGWWLLRDWTPTAGMLAAVTIAVAVLLPTMARGASLAVMSVVAALGATIFLMVMFSPTVKRMRPLLIIGFFLFVPTFAANDWFYHGMHTTDPQLYKREGVRVMMSLRYDGAAWRRQLGTDLRFVERGLEGRLLVGTGRGVMEVDEQRVRSLPIGSAGDNVAVDKANRRVIAATRDGRVSLLTGSELGVSAQALLPHGALVTRLAPEGVYALDEWSHVGLYDPTTLQERKTWRITGVSDLLPDGEGGFFVSTLWGGVSRHFADGRIAQGTARRWGVFHLLAYDRAKGRLFVGNMAGRTIGVYRASDLQRVDSLVVGRGIRNLHWDDETNLLVAGNYFSGALIALDGETWREAGRLSLGRRLRAIAPDGPGRVLVTTAAGFYAVDLPAAFRKSFTED